MAKCDACGNDYDKSFQAMTPATSKHSPKQSRLVNGLGVNYVR